MTWDRQAAQAAWNAKRQREKELAAFLAQWAETAGIAEGEVAAEVGDALADSPGMQAHAAVLIATGEAPQPLVDAATGIACIASLDPDARAAEDYWYGHGDKPRRTRKRAA
jgi:hypothetical protein